MSNFDSKFYELQVKITSVLQMLITEFPEAAARAKQIIDDAPAQAEIQETIQADAARGNAVAALITGAGQLLSTTEVSPEVVVGLEPYPDIGDSA